MITYNDQTIAKSATTILRIASYMDIVVLCPNICSKIIVIIAVHR